MKVNTPKRLDFSKPIFVIEHCKDCSTHGWNTRHNERKYLEFAVNLANSIKEHVPSAMILFNQVPKAWFQSNLYCQLISNNDQTNDVYDVMPRLGSFEVSTVWKGVDTLIYSKLLVKMWPNTVALGVKVGNYQADLDSKMKIREVSRKYYFDPKSVQMAQRTPRESHSLPRVRTANTSMNATVFKTHQDSAVYLSPYTGQSKAELRSSRKNSRKGKRSKDERQSRNKQVFDSIQPLDRPSQKTPEQVKEEVVDVIEKAPISSVKEIKNPTPTKREEASEVKSDAQSDEINQVEQPKSDSEQEDIKQNTQQIERAPEVAEKVEEPVESEQANNHSEKAKSEPAASDPGEDKAEKQSEASEEKQSDASEESDEIEVDITQMNTKSRRIMILLLIHLLESELTTQDLFGEFIFLQSVKRQVGKNNDRKMIQSDLLLIQADDFFTKLKTEEII